MASQQDVTNPIGQSVSTGAREADRTPSDGTRAGEPEDLSDVPHEDPSEDLSEVARVVSPSKSRRVITRNAMRAARRWSPAPFVGALMYCQRPTARSRLWHTQHPQAGYATAWISHPATCKLIHVCPVCSAARNYAQQQLLQRALRGWAHLGDDHRVFLMTLTVRHTREHSLADLIAVVTGAFTATMNSRLARRLRTGGIYDGYLKTLEITWSPISGWNVHLHVLVFTQDAAGLLVAWDTTTGPHTGGLVAQWAHAVSAKSAARGMQPPVDALPRRQDLREASAEDAGPISGYLTKGGLTWSLAAEMTRSDAKRGRLSSLAPSQLLLAADDGNLRARAAWREYAHATKGVRRFASSTHDPTTRQTFQDYLQAAGEQAEIAEAHIAAGWGVDPRALAVRTQIEAEQAADAARAASMTPAERTAEAAAREQAERDYAQATEPSSRPLAAFAEAERLSRRDGRITAARLAASPDLLLDLQTIIEAAGDIDAARAVAQAFMDTHRLPLSTIPTRRVPGPRPRRRTRRDVEGASFGDGFDGDDVDDFDYFAAEARAEQRLERAGYGGREFDELMQQWERAHRYLRPRAHHPLWLIKDDVQREGMTSPHSP